jgi:hypothetical protein
MFSYTFYKTLHLLFILCFFTSIGFVSLRSDLMQKKSGKIMLGAVVFMIFLGGMGLLARLGVSHKEPFPLWVKIKLTNWVVLATLVSSLFKIQTKEYRAIMVGLILTLAWFTVWVAVYKPV